MCLAFSVEKNQSVSSVLFNPNVKNDAHERRLVQWGWVENDPASAVNHKVAAVEPWPSRTRPPFPPNPQGPRQSQRSPPHSTTLTRQVHGNRGLAGCSRPAIFRSCAALGKPIAVPRPESSSVVRRDTLLIVPPHRTVIIVQWDVCETMKQQRNRRNSMIRNNNLFGNTFLNVFNTLFHLQQMLKQTNNF